MSSTMLAYDQVKMLTGSWLTAGDRQKRRLRPPRDVRLGAFEAEDDHEPNRGGATGDWSPERPSVSSTVAVNSGRVLKMPYD
jgi:hypothetical protein